ncbi:protein FAR1-RELATED SEQUENCE [Citrus sinensis]|uniref:Protein FAR1-RELATED SEQUENCE n=1 Tax=Citrus sinensis TaxID=2711 RepID=A0ACB8NVZ8_CITSI|nr:protein FAR1-RELATED SEQUENCE [Citrus sinensis]
MSSPHSSSNLGISIAPNVGLQASDVLGSHFDSVEDAELWYNNYARMLGFGVRKDDMRRGKKSGRITIRRWVCHFEGVRDERQSQNCSRVREPRPITRTGCRASFRVNYDDSVGKYIAKEFRPEHNHHLASTNEVHLIRSHRKVTDAELAQAKALRHVGVKTCQFMDYMADQVEGPQNLRFTRKDMQNTLDASTRAEVGDSNSDTTIAYFAAKSEHDPGLCFEYTLDDENRLRNLFWADCVARYDYQCFGDVLAFDATYKTNVYHKPLVTLVGTNHHFRTTVFGFALLADETIDSYTWLLQTFLSTMGNRMPVSVITDGDKAMSKAIKTVFTGCIHRLCCWHLERNAQANLKNEDFTRKFRDLMLTPMTVTEFETQWSAVVAEFALEHHAWVQKMYSKRCKWAEAYLRGTFFAGMRSTQRCESMNAYLSRFVQHKLKLYEFVRQIDRALRNIRTTETSDEFKTKYSTPVLRTHLQSLEKHAAQLFPLRVFSKVRDEMLREGAVIEVKTVKAVDVALYTVTEFGTPTTCWNVIHNLQENHIQCSCQMMESVGLPCRHMFHVLKVEQIEKIPDNMVLRRWTKKAKEHNTCRTTKPEVDTDVSEMARFSALSAACNKMCYNAAKNVEAYENALVEINRLTLTYEQQYELDGLPNKKLRMGTKLRNPAVVKTKGAMSKAKCVAESSRKCGKCRQVGHTARTCSIQGNDSPQLSVDGNGFAAFDSSSTQNLRAFAGVSPTLLGHASNQFSNVFYWWPH